MTALRASFVALVLLSANSVFAADAPPGAESCSGCHTSSTSVQTPVPPLKGRTATDIESQMIEFKTGKRPGTIMDRIAKGFSEEEIRAIAAWYAAQK